MVVNVMRKNKKKYLNSYLLQQAKILRLREMITINPKMKLEYEQQISNAEYLRVEIENKISNVDSDILSEILFQKYICGKTLEEISIIINYSKRHTERLHITALEKFEL